MALLISRNAIETQMNKAVHLIDCGHTGRKWDKMMDEGWRIDCEYWEFMGTNILTKTIPWVLHPTNDFDKHSFWNANDTDRVAKENGIRCLALSVYRLRKVRREANLNGSETFGKPIRNAIATLKWMTAWLERDAIEANMLLTDMDQFSVEEQDWSEYRYEDQPQGFYRSGSFQFQNVRHPDPDWSRVDYC
jgi:hypothetical protein